MLRTKHCTMPEYFQWNWYRNENDGNSIGAFQMRCKQNQGLISLLDKDFNTKNESFVWHENLDYRSRSTTKFCVSNVLENDGIVP